MSGLRVVRYPLALRMALRVFVLSLIVPLSVACSQEELPNISDLPERVREIPGVPAALDELPGVLDELGLPDMSQVANLPEIEDLPSMQTPSGGIIYSGPTEYRVGIGERVPGTDIELVGLTEDGGAQFTIAGLRSNRSVGDSLDYDGGWTGLDSATYNLRTRIYRIGSNSVRAAGVHQLTIEDIMPVERDVNLGDHTVRFPYGSSAAAGQMFKGMTLGYVGKEERGGKIYGLPSGDYPYRKVGDSIGWRGLLRSDIPIEYAVRMVLYGESNANVGGVVKIALPNN